MAVKDAKGDLNAGAELIATTGLAWYSGDDRSTCRGCRSARSDSSASSVISRPRGCANSSTRTPPVTWSGRERSTRHSAVDAGDGPRGRRGRDEGRTPVARHRYRRAPFAPADADAGTTGGTDARSAGSGGVGMTEPVARKRPPVRHRGRRGARADTRGECAGRGESPAIAEPIAEVAAEANLAGPPKRAPTCAASPRKAITAKKTAPRRARTKPATEAKSKQAEAKSKPAAEQSRGGGRGRQGGGRGRGAAPVAEPREKAAHESWACRRSWRRTDFACSRWAGSARSAGT